MKKNKTLLIVAFVLLLSITSVKSFSQAANANPSVSIGLEVGIPTSNGFKDFYSVGFGGSAKLAIPVVTNGAVTLSAGISVFLVKRLAAINIPLII